MKAYLAYLLISTYYMSIALLCLFSFHRYQLLYLYFRYRPRNPVEPPPPAEWPRVTVQLPIYNEQFVASRLIQSMAALQYPKDRLQVQVLDDSTDETCSIAASACEGLQAQGYDVQFIHRENRHGFKAGALENGLLTATGEFVAIFDADFIPQPDYLVRVIPYFDAPNVGMVQVRWEHLNRGYSTLTECESMMLDGHFVIEHSARYWSGRFLNFNGTAGVWRKTAIADAGGWQHDTLTEDMELSYRAQLRGWQMVYQPHIAAPGELPPDMNSFKSQQHRWTKGSIQTCLKHLGRIWRSNVPFKVKSEATFHLCNNFAYLFLLIMSVLMLPNMLLREAVRIDIPLWIDLLLFLGATLSMGTFYLTAQREVLKEWIGKARYLPMMICLGIGLCVNNSRAVLEALFGVKSEFVRTPKFGMTDTGGVAPGAGSYIDRKRVLAVVELLLAFYYAVILVYCMVEEKYLVIPFMLLFFVGFSYVGFASLFGFRKPKLVPQLVPVAP